MNKKQLIVALGLSAYIVGGLIALFLDLETFFRILRSQLNLLIPILQIYIPLVVSGIIAIYFLRDKKK